MFSIIIPTFNRKKLIYKAIHSAVNFSKNFNEGEEIIIIDDASDDGTQKLVQEKFKDLLIENKISYKFLHQNKGVTNAKNIGAEKSNNEWLVFLDSDDQLLIDSRKTIIKAIEKFKNADVLFFRCIDDDINFIGGEIKNSFKLNINDYLKKGTFGECLPVIKKSKFLEYKYDSDLRGFEGLAYLRMLKDDLNLYIIKDAARKYDDEGIDRLSTRAGVFKRADLILEGYKRYKYEVYNIIRNPLKIYLNLKIFQFYLLSLLNRLIK